MSFHFFLSATNSLHLLTTSTWRCLSTSSFHPFLSLPLLLVPSSSWVKIFLGILSSCILSRWPNQLILCRFIHFTIFSPLLISSSSRFVRLFHSPFSYLGPRLLLNIFLSKIWPCRSTNHKWRLTKTVVNLWTGVQSTKPLKKEFRVMEFVCFPVSILTSPCIPHSSHDAKRIDGTQQHTARRTAGISATYVLLLYVRIKTAVFWGPHFGHRQTDRHTWQSCLYVTLPTVTDAGSTTYDLRLVSMYLLPVMSSSEVTMHDLVVTNYELSQKVTCLWF